MPDRPASNGGNSYSNSGNSNCPDCPKPRQHYDSQEVVHTTQDVDRSQVINTTSVVPVAPRMRETNHLVIRKNTVRNVGVVQHNHTIIEKEIRYRRPVQRHKAVGYYVMQGYQTVYQPAMVYVPVAVPVRYAVPQYYYPKQYYYPQHHYQQHHYQPSCCQQPLSLSAAVLSAARLLPHRSAAGARLIFFPFGIARYSGARNASSFLTR